MKNLERMHVTSVSFRPEHFDFFKNFGKERGLSISEIARTAIDLLKSEWEQSNRAEKKDSADTVEGIFTAFFEPSAAHDPSAEKLSCTEIAESLSKLKGSAVNVVSLGKYLAELPQKGFCVRGKGKKLFYVRKL